MRRYEEPNLEILYLMREDVITMSPGDGTGADDEIGGDVSGDNWANPS